MATIAEALDLAVGHHQAGRIAEAEQLYRQILAVAPQQPDAWHLLGVIAHQAGRPHDAMEAIRKAIEIAPQNAAFHSNLGAALAAIGQPQQAAQSFQEALRLQPNYIDAQLNLGTSLEELGQADEALAWFQRAAALAPGRADIHFRIARALKRLQRRDEAVAAYRQVIALRPNDAGAHNNLGNLLKDRGELDEAIGHYRQALEFDAGLAEAYNNLGSALEAQGLSDEALRQFREAIRCREDFSDPHFNLANALNRRGDLAGALEHWRESLRLQPNFSHAWQNQGNALMAHGQVEAAIECFRTALRIDPRDAAAHNHLGLAYAQQSQRDLAIDHYHRAIEIDPDFAPAHSNLGNVYQVMGRLDEAVACYRASLCCVTDFAEAYNNLGHALMDQGRLAEAGESYRRAVELKPDYVDVQSNLLFLSNYDPDRTARDVWEQHRQWGNAIAEPAALTQRFENSPEPGRRLRVGYVSPDFRRHVVALFLEPILANASASIENYLYAEVPAPDAVSDHLRSLASVWCSTCGLTDQQMADRIREDRIDILVDLAGHTAHNRLLVFAKRVAPVQVTYLGYPHATGLAAIDYRVTDAVADPPDATTFDAASCAGEKPIQLSRGFCCFKPPPYAPPVSPLPALSSGQITFGALHRLPKINASVLDLWARVLQAVPRSRLLVLRNTLHGSAHEALHRELVARGIEPERFDLLHELGGDRNHLHAYESIDLTLDTFPWSGHATACEALWQGVPVVTLRGDRHAARMVAAVLTSVGTQEWIADSPDEYVAIAARLAEDVSRLAEMRAGLRSRMATSALCDWAGFTRDLELAYQQMWQEWCRTQARTSDELGWL